MARFAHGELHQILRQNGAQRTNDLGRVDGQNGDNQCAHRRQVATGNVNTHGRRPLVDEDGTPDLEVELVAAGGAQFRVENQGVGLAHRKTALQDETAAPGKRPNRERNGRVTGDTGAGLFDIDGLGEFEVNSRLAEAGRRGGGLRKAKLRGHRQECLDTLGGRLEARVGGAHAGSQNGRDAITGHGDIGLNLGVAVLGVADEAPGDGDSLGRQFQTLRERWPLDGGGKLTTDRQQAVGRK